MPKNSIKAASKLFSVHFDAFFCWYWVLDRYLISIPRRHLKLFLVYWKIWIQSQLFEGHLCFLPVLMDVFPMFYENKHKFLRSFLYQFWGFWVPFLGKILFLWFFFWKASFLAVSTYLLRMRQEFGLRYF